jgi:vanillate O-demethylase monooxygenase subunit
MDPLNKNNTRLESLHVPQKHLVRRLHPRRNRRQALGRQICGEKMVFYRGLENRVAAVEDFCPHRGAPLSLGYVDNGNLVCGYHGLVMGCDGKTVSMPGQRVRGFPCNKTFAVVERYGFIWVWPGDQALADPALIHHLEWAVSDEWAYGGGLFHIGCDYRLMIDNLMDLTHETYVHASSIGQKEIDEPRPSPPSKATKWSPPGTWKTSWPRRSGAWPCAATAWPTMCRWTAGRSAASPRPAMC